MTPQFFLENLLSWAIQVLTIASIGAMLPVVLRLRHPRSHLIYCYALLTTCLVLPFIQTWQRPVVSIGGGSNVELSTVAAAAPGASSIETAVPWEQIILWALLLGVVVRVFRFAAGLWQIRRYRTSSAPLFPVPESVMAARALVGQDALVGLSSDDVGPVTFGLRHPLILLPESFLALDPDAQCAIVCHELLHVQRRDWLTTVIEEIIGAGLWFHPAVWWLLNQTKLAREQVVDAEVIRLTAAPEPYIGALLAMAGADLKHSFVTAPLFLRKRHLTQRMHSLLLEVPMSRLRLLSSYAAMACVLAATGWLALVSFPLMGQPQIQEASAPDGTGISVDPGGNVLHRSPIFYPWEAQQNRIDGTITVGLTLNAKGEVVDAHVLSGPDELRKDVLQSVLQWHYVADGSASRTVQARIDFRIPGTTSKYKESITFYPGDSIPNGGRQTNDNGVLETIDVGNLPESLRGDVWQRVVSFKGQPFSETLMSQIENAVNGADSHLRLRWGLTPDKNHTLRFVLATIPGEQPGPGSAEGPGVGVFHVGGGVSLTRTFTLTSDAAGSGHSELTLPQYAELARKARSQSSGQEPVTATDDEQAAFNSLKTNEEREHFIEQFWLRREQSRVQVPTGPTTYNLSAVPEAVAHVGGGVSAPRVLSKVDPQYSEAARKARIQGTVVVEAIIGKDGAVQVARIVRSLGFGLDEKAIEALQQWVFEPATQNGIPVAVSLNIEVNFNLRD